MKRFGLWALCFIGAALALFFLLAVALVLAGYTASDVEAWPEWRHALLGFALGTMSLAISDLVIPFTSIVSRKDDHD